MDSNLKGNIGEAKAISHFIEDGYEVYLPFGTATKCDLIVLKNNITERVSVKSTSKRRKNGKYVVKISQGKMNKQTGFDKNSSDLLFAYLLPENRHLILKSKDIDREFEITVD